MTGLTKLIGTETRLFLREPVGVFFALVFPPLLLAILGAVPAFREATPELGGRRVIDLYIPILIGLTLAMLALSALPTALATYRERGILRRLETTPARPLTLLVAQLLVNLGLAVAVVAVMVAVGALVFTAPLPRQPLGFLLAFVLAAAAVLALGLLVAAVAPTGKAASGIGTMLFFPLMFFGGLWVPREGMPAVLRRIGDFTPLGAGVQSLQDAAAGGWPRPLHLAVLAACTLVAGLLAARLFRWE